MEGEYADCTSSKHGNGSRAFRIVAVDGTKTCMNVLILWHEILGDYFFRFVQNQVFFEQNSEEECERHSLACGMLFDSKFIKTYLLRKLFNLEVRGAE